MRIGVIGPLGPDLFADNIADALQRMGHIAIPLGPLHPKSRSRIMTRGTFVLMQAMPRLDELVQGGIVKAALRAECEIVVNVDERMAPNAVATLRSNGVKVAFWSPDSMLSLGRALMLLAPYEAIFFKEPHLVDHLRANLTSPVFYLPEACNPHWHRVTCDAATEPYFVIAGTMRPSRVRLLERLIEKGIPLRLYGPGFPRWLGETPVRSVHAGMYLAREDKARVFRSAIAVLNTLHPAEVRGMNARLFEAAGCGAAVITEARPALAELFHAGSEVLAFTNFEQLIDHVSLLLTENGLSRRLGDAAMRRAHADHTYEVRLAALLERVA